MAAKRQTRQCKYCPAPAGRNITFSGRNKGIYRTCGSRTCLRKQYEDPVVNEKKRFNGQAICKHCREVFITDSGRQKWCKACAPDKASRRILQRYGLSNPEYLERLKSQNGRCAICQIHVATDVDHDHTTGQIRKLLCTKCNLGLHYIEVWEFKQKALDYLHSFC